MVFCCRELLFSKLDRHPQQQPPPPVLRAATGDTRQSFSTIDKCFFPRIAGRHWCAFPVRRLCLAHGEEDTPPPKNRKQKDGCLSFMAGIWTSKISLQHTSIYYLMHIYIYNVYIKHPGWRFTEHSNEASWHHYRFLFSGVGGRGGSP